VGVYVSGDMNLTSASITEWTVLKRIFGHESASCSDKYADSQPSLTKQLRDAAVPLRRHFAAEILHDRLLTY
jgi:hypothetical protein